MTAAPGQPVLSDPTDTTLRLTFPTVVGATYFRIYVNGAEWTIMSVADPSTVDDRATTLSGLTPGTEYTVTVKAGEPGSESDFSPPAVGSTTGGAPSPPPVVAQAVVARTTLRLVDGATEVRLALAGTNYDSPYRCKSYDLGFPDPRAVSTDTTGIGGVTDMTTLWGARTVALSLTVWNDSTGTRHQHMDVLRGMCHPAKRPWLYAQCEGWPQERRIALRAQPLTCVVGQPNVGYVETSLSFVAPSGLFEIATQVTIGPIRNLVGSEFSVAAGDPTSAAISVPAGDTGSTGFSITPGSGDNIALIDNVGTAPAAPIFYVNGGSTAPLIFNRTDNVRLAFLQKTVPVGHFAVIDVAKRTAYLDGDPGQNIYNWIDWGISRWFLLQPGQTYLEFDSSGDGDDASLIVTYTPRFF